MWFPIQHNPLLEYLATVSALLCQPYCAPYFTNVSLLSVAVHSVGLLALSPCFKMPSSAAAVRLVRGGGVLYVLTLMVTMPSGLLWIFTAIQTYLQQLVYVSAITWATSCPDDKAMQSLRHHLNYRRASLMERFAAGNKMYKKYCYFVHLEWMQSGG